MTAIALVVFFTATPSVVLCGYLVASVFVYIAFRGNAHAPENKAEISKTVDIDAKQVARNLVSYALPLIPVAAAGWASGLADRYVIGGALGLAAAGCYAAVYALMSRPFLMVGDIIELTVRQVYYGAVAANDAGRARIVFIAWLGLAAVVACIGFVFALLFHEQLANWLLAEPYRQSADLMPWIAAGYACLMLSQVFSRVCYAYHDTNSVLWIEAVGATFRLATLFPLIFQYGLPGAAAAVLLGFAVQLMAAALLAHRCQTQREVKVAWLPDNGRHK
jgi:O-antigen/teichoic acid export membrane protein